uniref:Uncharacterized protein n=1 Tax=Brassica oleracea TaxID=3712 RepID=A0A3P6H0W3_BRAOL|nr:unnamed protein product [Brassica oleracea]
MNNMDLESREKQKKLRLVIRPQHRTTPAPQHRSTVRPQRRQTTRPQHRSTLPRHRRSTVGAYQSRRSLMYVKILGKEIPLHNQTSLRGRRGGIGRKKKTIKDGPQVESALLFMLRNERDCSSVLLEDKQKGNFELDFECHRF